MLPVIEAKVDAIQSVAVHAHKQGISVTFEGKKAPKTTSQSTPEQKKLESQRRQQQSEASRPLRKELEKIDQKMQALGNEKGSLETLLSTAKAPAEIAQTGKRLKAIESEIGTLEERWLELTEQLEATAV